jgi:hypothetical protein
VSSKCPTIRFDATDVQAFADVVGMENGNSAIDVDLMNDKGTKSPFLKSCWIIDNL